MPTVRLDHAACLGQLLLVLAGFHEIQQVGVAGQLHKIRMGGDQGLAPVDERFVRGEEIDDVSSPFQLRNRYWTLEKIARFVR